jgi:hypothetical protein
MATSEYGGDQLHLTKNCRNFVKMHAIRTLRQFSGRYTKSDARGIFGTIL